MKAEIIKAIVIDIGDMSVGIQQSRYAVELPIYEYDPDELKELQDDLHSLYDAMIETSCKIYYLSPEDQKRVYIYDDFKQDIVEVTSFE
jgi:hypothetical protein